MSQIPPPQAKIVPHPPKPLPPRQENGLGIAGFITSVAGLITCGSLSIFAVILSALGLRKEPKGLAVAGLILGLIGIFELAIVVVLTFTGVTLTRTFSQNFSQMALQAQLQHEASLIGGHWEKNGRLPSQAEADQLLLGHTDVWGNPIEYETDGFTFSIRSRGSDGRPQTADDVVVGPYADAESARNSPFGDGWEDLSVEGFEELQKSLEEMQTQAEQMEQAQDQLDNAAKQPEEAAEQRDDDSSN